MFSTNILLLLTSILMVVVMDRGVHSEFDDTDLPELGLEEKIRILEWAVEEGLAEPLINMSGQPMALESINFSKLKEWSTQCDPKAKDAVEKTNADDEDNKEKCQELTEAAFQTVTALSLEHLAEYLEMRNKAKQKKDEL